MIIAADQVRLMLAFENASPGGAEGMVPDKVNMPPGAGGNYGNAIFIILHHIMLYHITCKISRTHNTIVY